MSKVSGRPGAPTAGGHPTADGAARSARRKRKPIAATIVLIICIVGAVAAGGYLAYQWLRPAAPSGAVQDLDGNWVVFDPEDSDGAGEINAAIEGVDSDFQVPAVGLSVGLGAIRVNSVINPPDFKRVFQITNFGVDLAHADSGTVYLATHSLRGGGRGPGNYLFDVDSGQPTVHAGDTVIVENLEYRVDQTTKIQKSELSGDARVWTNDPGKLVLITCMQDHSGHATAYNLVLFAHLAA